MSKGLSNIQWVILVSVSLAALILIAYEPVRHNEFVQYDDKEFITENPHIQSGFTASSVTWALTKECGANWHPLTLLSYMLDIELFGLNPLGFHLHNVVLHIAGTLLLFWILRSMTGDLWPSAFAAMVFGLHPLRVESVAWAAERKDVLCGVFWMLTLAAYLYYVRRGGIFRYLLLLVCFALGLMAKPMMVTLPLILLVLDFWPLGRMPKGPSQNRSAAEFSIVRPASLRQLILEKIPLFMLTAVSCAVTYSIQQKSAAVTDLNVLPMTHRIANALVSYMMYLVKTAWPHPLAVLYPHPAGGVPVWMWLLCFGLLAAGTCLILAGARKQPYLLTGWLWYGITLVPVIGLVQVGSQAMADRYTYLPSVGIAMMIAWAAAKFSSPWPARKIILSVLSGLLAAGMILGTRNQLAYWKDTETLYMHTLNVTRNNDLIHCYLGIFLSGQNRIEQAETHFRQALDINPRNYQACYNLAASLWKRGNFREAIELYHQALNLGPENTTSLNNLSWYLSTAPQEQSRNPSEAIRLAQKACRLTSFQDPDILDTLAVAYAGDGRFQEAIQTAQQALGLAQAANQTELADEISRKLKLYKAGQTGIYPPGQENQQQPLPSP